MPLHRTARAIAGAAVVVLAATASSAATVLPPRSPAAEAASPATADEAATRARPKPLLPDLTTLRASGVRIERRGAGRVLRFATTLANVGVGPLEAFPDSATRCPRGQRYFRQRLRIDRNRDGKYDPGVDVRTTRRDGACGLFHPTHGHWHIDGSMRYTLLDRSGRRVAVSRKVGFCLRDSRRVPGADAPTGRTYGDCARDRRQGISPGWGDLYDADLDGQVLPLGPGVVGAYCLKMTADPFDYFRESDEANNASETPLRIRGLRVRVAGHGCRERR